MDYCFEYMEEQKTRAALVLRSCLLPSTKEASHNNQEVLPSNSSWSRNEMWKGWRSDEGKEEESYVLFGKKKPTRLQVFPFNNKI